MEPTGPIPFRVSSAYATTPSRVEPQRPAQPAGVAIKPTTDRFEPTLDQSQVRKLVAGTVKSPINRGIGFDGDSTEPAPKPSPAHEAKVMQFHALSAARVEAATGVALGRMIDVKG